MKAVKYAMAAVSFAQLDCLRFEDLSMAFLRHA